MKITDIESFLPNGFHDARLTAIHRNLCDETAILEIEVLTGLPDQSVEDRDGFQAAMLIFKEVKILVVDLPDSESSFRFPGAANIVITEDESGSFPDELLLKISAELHTYTIFVRDWLSNVRIAAAGVEFEWRGS